MSFGGGRLRLLLIQPSQIIEGGKVCNAKKIMFPHPSLPGLASLTPPEFQVEFIKVYFEDVPSDDPADLIGISSMIPQAPRAYKNGNKFQRCGKKID